MNQFYLLFILEQIIVKISQQLDLKSIQQTNNNIQTSKNSFKHNNRNFNVKKQPPKLESNVLSRKSDNLPEEYRGNDLEVCLV